MFVGVPLDLNCTSLLHEKLKNRFEKKKKKKEVTKNKSGKQMDPGQNMCVCELWKCYYMETFNKSARNV